MSWAANDLVADADLTGYERSVLTQFAAVDWTTRRQKALEDWLFPMLEGRGFDPLRLRTRAEPTKVWGYTSAAYTDKTSLANTDDGLVLSSILASSSDALYVASDRPFRGLSVRALEAVNTTVAATMALTVWCDRWLTPPQVSAGTTIAGKPFAAGGPITWAVPEGAVTRAVNGSEGYWCRLTCSSAPTSAKAGPVLVIRRSRLCAAATCRTLSLIFREAPIGQDGPWKDKADWYEAEANAAFERVIAHIGGEFDTDGSDAIDSSEQDQTSDAVTGGGWTWSRA